jgi:hypothetical protein
MAGGKQSYIPQYVQVMVGEINLVVAVASVHRHQVPPAYLNLVTMEV